MCGFAGLVAWNERYRISRETLSRMGQAIAHRGPDAQGLWISDEQAAGGPQCGMVFARLAILDLDARSMQPMSDGRRWIVFNGEIYNFRELRKELSSLRPGHQWKTSGDTEVLLAAYDVWGESCVQHLNGMYALAVWDTQERTLYFARDRMGQKPLYLAIAPGGAAVGFASELGALRELDWAGWEINPAAVGEYLHTGYIAAPKTIYKGISKLPPASWMTCRGKSSPQPQNYFDPNHQGSAATDSTSVKQAIVTAVRRQLVADVPLGCFLSGGIDSSVIAAAMKSVVSADQRVLTFAIGFDDARYDETAFAAEVAKHLGTEHRQFVVRPDAAEDLSKLAAVFGEPFGDSSALPTHYLSRETKRHVTVALSGDGGDELFGGYDRYRAMRLATTARKIPSVLRNAAAALPGSHPKSAAARLKRFALTLDLPAPARYSAYMALFDHQAAARIFPDGAGADDLIERTYQRLADGRDAVQAALATDRLTYLPEDLLTKVDRASMLHALEVRAPFMDHDLVSLAGNLQVDQLLRGGGKRMLREAFAPNLPKTVFSRRKMGFAVPIGDWLRNQLRPMMNDLLNSSDSFAAGHFDRAAVQNLVTEHADKRADHSQRLYSLMMLELWWRQRRLVA